MTTDAPSRRRTPSARARRRPALAVAGLGVVALVASGCSAAGATERPPRVAAATERPPRVAAASDGELPGSPTGEPGAPVGGPADGVDADLLARFEAARDAAAAEDVELRITSGRRTAEEQQQLVDEAVAKHGVPEAYRWVLPPETSAHVQGLAIDVGATQGAYWLAEHGLEFGLCQTYANEVWHFEKLPDGADTCPEQHPDSSWGW